MSLPVRLLFSCLLLLAPVSMAQAQEQTNDEYYREPVNKELQEAGWFLKKHSSQYFIGLGLIGGGTLLNTIAINNDAPSLAIFSGSLVLAGLVMQIISHRQIGKAGEALQRSTLSSRWQLRESSDTIGLGLRYSF